MQGEGESGAAAGRCEICEKKLSAKQVSAGVSVCGESCAQALEKRNGTNLKEISANLRADAPAALPLQLPEIKRTGLFETVMPQRPGHLVDYFMVRRDALPFLERGDAFYELAADEIQRQGFPLKPRDADLLKAPAPVFECYQLRDAYEQLQIHGAVFSSPGVVKAVAAALAEKYGKLSPSDELPREMREGLEGTDEASKQVWQRRDAELYEDAAGDQIWKALNAAIEMAVLGQRLVLRPREPDARQGRNMREWQRDGGLAKRPERVRLYAEFQAEVNRLRKDHSELSRHRIAGLVAKKFDVSSRTIRDHTEDPLAPGAVQRRLRKG